MTMKKFINAPDSFVDEALEGIVMAHEDKVMPVSYTHLDGYDPAGASGGVSYEF